MQDPITYAIQQAWEDEQRRVISYAIEQAAESLTRTSPRRSSAAYDLGGFRLDDDGRTLAEDVLRAAREVAAMRGYHADRGG